MGRLPVEFNAFVGRHDHVAEGARLLQAARLVTFTGAGGVGKTRLALRLAEEVAPAFRDGACLVELADVTKADHMYRAVAEALGILDNSAEALFARIIGQVRDMHLLVVLDNCEHLVEHVKRLVQTVLKAARGVRILTTSRVKLGVPGEEHMPVEPLPPSEALQLLIERGAAASADWRQALRDHGRLPEADMTAATRLCESVDGIPLAIELAAARLDSMTVHEIADSLLDRLRALGDVLVDDEPEQHNHRSLRATMDWTYGLLSKAEQRMWAVTSVFAGGHDLDAAQAVCAAQGIDAQDVLPLLTGLVRHSVVRAVNHDGRTHYRMLDTVREYGAQLVPEGKTRKELCQAHADYMAALLDEAARQWFGPDEVKWMRRLHKELPNIRVALDFFLTQPGQARRGLCMAVAAASTRFGVFGGRQHEIRLFLTSIVDEYLPQACEQHVTALALAAWFPLILGDPAAADPLLRRCEATAAELGISQTSAALQYALGTELWLTEPNPTTARHSIEILGRAAELFQRAGQPGSAHMAHMFQAFAAGFLGNATTATTLAHRLLAEAEQHQAPWCIAWALWANALVELRHGDTHTAARLLHRALTAQHDMGDAWGPGWAMWLAALIAAATGRPAPAAQLFGAAWKLHQQIRVNVQGLVPWRREQERAEVRVRRELGDDEFEVQVAVGASLSYEDAMELAALPQPRDEPPPSARDLLTPREYEVAELLTAGLHNKDIAQSLQIAYRTVEKHAENIYAKLGVSSRVGVATWMVRRDPLADTASPPRQTTVGPRSRHDPTAGHVDQAGVDQGQVDQSRVDQGGPRRTGRAT